MRESEAKKLRISYEPLRRPFTITGYGSGKTTPVGRFEARLTVDQASADVQVHVVSNDVPLLVGQPFSEQAHVTLVRRKNIVRIFEERDQSENEDGTLANLAIPALPPRQVNLWAKVAFVIPPNYVGFVALGSDNVTDSHIFVHGTLHEPRGEYVPSSVLRQNAVGNLCIPVANVSNSPLIVTQNQKIGRGTLCIEDNSQPSVPVNYNKRSLVKTISEKGLTVGTSISDTQKEALIAVINEYRDCFATCLSEIGCIRVTEMKIEVTTDDPVTYRPYHISNSERQAARTMIDELKQAGVVTNSNSAYASPILLVAKKNGENSVCVDFRALNKITKTDSYPLPIIDDQLDRLETLEATACFLSCRLVLRSRR